MPDSMGTKHSVFVGSTNITRSQTMRVASNQGVAHDALKQHYMRSYEMADRKAAGSASAMAALAVLSTDVGVGWITSEGDGKPEGISQVHNAITR